MTNTLAKDKEISDRWRGFADIADLRHLANRVEREVVDALVSAVREAYPRLSHRYYASKAKWLGKKTLAYWDRNAPLPEEPSQTVGLVTRRRQCSEPTAISRRAWLRSPATSSPKSMDRCAGARGEIARRLLAPDRAERASLHSAQLPGKPRDVMTLAHELGHGVHQVLANAQGPLMAPTPLTLAETASVFGEMLTFRALLEQTRDPRERKALLASKVEDMINTVVNNIAFYSFERKVHTERRDGEPTSDRLGEIWLEVQRESFWGRPSTCRKDTRTSGVTSRTSSTRRSTSMRTRSAIAL